MSTLAEELALDVTAAIASGGEEVTIGAWIGQAIVDGGPRYLENVPGGAYPKLRFTILCSKADLDAVVPAAQMDVTARGKELRIPDDGIEEYVDSYLITAVGRTVPR